MFHFQLLLLDYIMQPQAMQWEIFPQSSRAGLQLDSAVSLSIVFHSTEANNADLWLPTMKHTRPWMTSEPASLSSSNRKYFQHFFSSHYFDSHSRSKRRMCDDHSRRSLAGACEMCQYIALLLAVFIIDFRKVPACLGEARKLFLQKASCRASSSSRCAEKVILACNICKHRHYSSQ